jgi:hypothetical protein
MMKRLVPLLLFVLSTTLPAQTTLRTYTSPDGKFQFKYSSLLVRCMEQDHDAVERGPWLPSDSCEGYIPVCDENVLGSPGSVSVVCIAYPNERFKDYATFSTATFSVAEIKPDDSEKGCLSGSPNWGVDPRGTEQFTIINNVRFKMFENQSGASSHHLDERLYRTFHRRGCFQMSIRIATVSSGAFDPPVKELSGKDWDEVNGRLRECLKSFRFLK